MNPMTTGLFTHPDCEDHVQRGHPERPERLAAVMARLEDAGLLDDFDVRRATEVEGASVLLAHPDSYMRHVQNQGAIVPQGGIVPLDPDTYMSSGSLRAAKLAAGAGVAATKAVLAGEMARAFCAVRPPGHHAEIAAAMGFCIFNNIAIAAETALLDPQINRIAILDFDVHHCNGTVDIFKDRPEVLVCSSFQDNFYPFRYLDFDNAHIISTRLSAGTEGLAFRHAIENDWLPALASHKPDFIFVSAGFDAHADDPLGSLALGNEDYRWITKLIVEQAKIFSKGRLVSMLEGGYDLTALADCVEIHAAELLAI